MRLGLRRCEIGLHVVTRIRNERIFPSLQQRMTRLVVVKAVETRPELMYD